MGSSMALKGKTTYKDGIISYSRIFSTENMKQAFNCVCAHGRLRFKDEPESNPIESYKILMEIKDGWGVNNTFHNLTELEQFIHLNNIFFLMGEKQ